MSCDQAFFFWGGGGGGWAKGRGREREGYKTEIGEGLITKGGKL